MKSLFNLSELDSVAKNLIDSLSTKIIRIDGIVGSGKTTLVDIITGLTELDEGVLKIDETDITDLEAFRQAKKAQAAKQGIKLTPLPFIIKAVAKALGDFPNINASLSADGQSLIAKKYIHMGMAVDTPKGLVVPVIRDANKKSIYQLATEIVDLAGKAQKGQLHPDEMKGGTFTISSLGVLGTTAFTPIINMPEVAILGVSKSAIKPVWMNESWQPRMMLPLSLSLDHRVIDGAEGARFMAQVVGNLKDIRDILL